MSEGPILLVERKAGAFHLTLNRSETRNAMSLAMVDALFAGLHAAEEEGARAVVLRGAGGHFCSGGDLRDMATARMQPTATGKDPVAEVNARFGHLCAAYAETGLAVIVLLEGAVMGGGFGLACVADIAIARETAVFRLPETGLGLIPAQIAPFLVERLGYSQAKRLAVTGGKIDAPEAKALGLIHHLVPDEEALEKALSVSLSQIDKAAPAALAATKRLVRRARLEDAASLVDDAARLFADAVRGTEGAEGIAAFMDKRPPAWAREEGT